MGRRRKRDAQEVGKVSGKTLLPALNAGSQHGTAADSRYTESSVFHYSAGQNAEAAQERLSLQVLRQTMRKDKCCRPQEFRTAVQKGQRVTRTSKEDVEEMDFTFQCLGCKRKFLYENESSIATHRRLHCKSPPSTADHRSPCPCDGCQNRDSKMGRSRPIRLTYGHCRQGKAQKTHVRFCRIL